MAPALSHLPVSQSQSREQERDPAGSPAPRPLSPSSRGLSKPKALAHLSPSLSPFSEPEGVAQLAGPSGALARPWSWLGIAACRQLPTSKGREAKGCVLKRSTHYEKNPQFCPPLELNSSGWPEEDISLLARELGSLGDGMAKPEIGVTLSL